MAKLYNYFVITSERGDKVICKKIARAPLGSVWHTESDFYLGRGEWGTQLDMKGPRPKEYPPKTNHAERAMTRLAKLGGNR